MKYLRWLWRSMAGIRWDTLWRILIGIAQVGLGLMMVWLSRRFIDQTIRTGTDRDVVVMVVSLVAVVLGGVVLRQLYYYRSILANTKQTNAIRLQAFSRLFARQLYSERDIHSGDVASRLSKDIEVVGEASTELLPRAVVTSVQLAGAFLLMFSMDHWLAIALLVLTPLVIVFAKLIARRLRQMTLDIREDESRIQMQVQEGMEHNAVLRSLGSEQWITDHLDTMQQRLRSNIMRRTRFMVVTRFALGFCFGLGYLLAFVWGGLQLRAGAITFGVMTSFLQLVGQIQHPILSLLNMIPAVIHTTASIDRLEEISVTGQPEGEASAAAPNLGGDGIRFEDVSFRYATGDRQILSHFTHRFRLGSKTAIMGETGIGKTTLFRMILGFIAPTEGRVEVSGDLCFVPQGNTLMSGTVRYNLQLARPEATDEELRQVLHTACADFVLDLPQGIDTELGERGSGLSEGQAQRIAIARGLLHDGDILLLDEISSSLDEPTERELYRRLFAAYPQKTMLFITHRPTVTEQCDDVVRL